MSERKGYNKVSERALRKLVSAVASDVSQVPAHEIDANVSERGNALAVQVRLPLPAPSLTQVLESWQADAVQLGGAPFDSDGAATASIAARSERLVQGVRERVHQLSGSPVSSVSLGITKVTIQKRGRLL